MQESRTDTREKNYKIKQEMPELKTPNHDSEFTSITGCDSNMFLRRLFLLMYSCFITEKPEDLR